MRALMLTILLAVFAPLLLGSLPAVRACEEGVAPPAVNSDKRLAREAPFPNAALYRSPQGFSLWLPDRTVAGETGDGTEIKARKWHVIVSRLGDAVEHLEQPEVRAELENRAIRQGPLNRCEVEWITESDAVMLNGERFYRRQFSGTVDGTAISLGTFYYGNVNGQHLRLVSIQFPGISDGIILMTKMVYTLAVE